MAERLGTKARQFASQGQWRQTSHCGRSGSDMDGGRRARASRVFTPGKDSRNDYKAYTHNYATISKRMRAGCPARQLKRLGTYWTTKIDGKSVVVFKSDSHMSQDGPELPNIDLWRRSFWNFSRSSLSPRALPVELESSSKWAM